MRPRRDGSIFRLPAAEAPIAQLVEHLICNQGVAGSSPARGTKLNQIVNSTFLLTHHPDQATSEVTQSPIRVGPGGLGGPDACNKLFSRYEDALAQYVQPYLTLGGVQGKDNKIPKTGRTRGPSTITQTKGDIRNISLSVTDGNPADCISVDPRSRTLKFRMPVAKARFVPRHAYKALCKMGVALLPEGELANYQSRLLRSGLEG